MANDDTNGDRQSKLPWHQIAIWAGSISSLLFTGWLFVGWASWSELKGDVKLMRFELERIKVTQEARDRRTTGHLSAPWHAAAGELHAEYRALSTSTQRRLEALEAAQKR